VAVATGGTAIPAMLAAAATGAAIGAVVGATISGMAAHIMGGCIARAILEGAVRGAINGAAMGVIGFGVKGALKGLLAKKAKAKAAGMAKAQQTIDSGADTTVAQKQAVQPKFVEGELFELSFTHNDIRVDILAEVKISGSRLTLKDVTIYPMKNGEAVNQIGPTIFKRLLDKTKVEAMNQGFTELAIHGTRVSGSSSALIDPNMNHIFPLRR